MTSINSVTGVIDSSELGLTLIHEHLVIRSESVYVQFPHLYNEEIELQRAIEKVNQAKSLGVKTICDPTIMELGRDIRLMEKVSLETGVQVIAGTGIYTYHYLPPHFKNRSIDYMADLFVRDIEVGIQNTSIKAGFLKCATDEQGITPDVEKVIRAVARAHLKTGAPIMTHSHSASGTGLMQLDILEEEGVNPSSILIGHVGDTDSLNYIFKVLDRGAFIGMDRYGITRLIGPERRNATVIDLVKRGFANRMFLSQDSCCTFDWYEPDFIEKVYPKWNMTYILEEIIPELKKAGVTEDHIQTMMVNNARSWFEGSTK
ncbi:phosphotriesterase family protein [Neobacillus niacini]|uniref:phosphotriesterase family protein n=1 Tax=Neobacillus niacini TaxID=86668 RepID=UPI00203EF058|nr:phosphotriesterase-related protein [Neobacillus niacini]MCM3691080.1 phosphotriesterase-related protein [Neobacillus niacini]